MKSSRLICLACAALLALSALPAIAGKTSFDLSIATLADINAAIDAGALSSEKLVGLYLKRLEAYDKKGPKINSVITMNPRALEEARELDRERQTKGRRSPLHGIPVMIKDLIDVAGLPTTAGYKPFGAPVPPRDAFVVEKLHAAGAIVLAKVATVNWFGNGFDDTHPIGRTLNPYNLDYSPGGSSNGVGASMAAWFATLGVGTDTGGSVQTPSAYNGIVGMVATQGLVSRSGIVPRGPTQDRAGPMGRSVYDIAALLSVMAGWDAEDGDTLAAMSQFPRSDWSQLLGSGDLKGKRIGVTREMFNTGAYDDEVKEIFERALADMRKAGAIIVDPVLTGLNLKIATSNATIGTSHPRLPGGIDLPYELIPTSNAYLARLGPNRPWKTLDEMLVKVGPKKLSTEYYKALEFKSPETYPDYISRQKMRAAVSARVAETIAGLELDAIVHPYQPVPPPPWDTEADKFPAGSRTNNLTSATGLPGVIMPAGYTSKNLPIALQFVTAPFNDLALLQVAYGYEQASKRRVPATTTPALPGEKFNY